MIGNCRNWREMHWCASRLCYGPDGWAEWSRGQGWEDNIITDVYSSIVAISLGYGS